jgi:hypothetical protein
MSESVRKNDTRSQADKARRAMLISRFGPLYPIIQPLGAVPLAYAAIGGVVYRSFLIAAFGFAFSFLFHVFVTAYFAMCARVGLEKCAAKSGGFRWAKLFVVRTIIHHVAMMSLFIWAGWYWLFVAGAVIYLIETAITLVSLKQQGCMADAKLSKYVSKEGDTKSNGSK